MVGYEDSVQPGSNSYTLDGFDKITGNIFSWMIHDDPTGPLLFEDFVDAANWLVKHHLPEDESTRVNGGHLCSGKILGSGDHEGERERTKAIRKAVRRIQLDALTRGYRPDHSVRLQRLFQDCTRTLEITIAGYVADLAYFGLPDDYEAARPFAALLDDARRQIAASPCLLDARSQALRAALRGAFDELAPETVTILTTALGEYEATGRRPAYDYSGVTLKLCKAIERELKRRVFVSWRTRLNSPAGRVELAAMGRHSTTSGSRDNGGRLLDWLRTGRGTPDLGLMRHCLREAGRGSRHPVLRDFAAHLKTFEGGDWLGSQDLFERLAAVSDRYRNGGAHDSVVTYELCAEALEHLVNQWPSTLSSVLLATRRIGEAK